jgi:uncharacterized membrane protein YczE
MKIIAEKAIRLMLGYFLYGLGIAMNVNSFQGLAPWSVFDQGLSLQFNITMGTATQIVGAIILILDWILGERLGWGTIGNVYFIGAFFDLIMVRKWVPTFQNNVLSFSMMILSMVVMSLATYTYLSAQMGAGPRDGLMIAITKRFKISVGLVRNLIEIVVLAAGWLMGGSVGLGTLVMAVLFGRVMQLIFKLFKFDVRQVTHRYIDQDLALIFKKTNIDN